MKIEITPLDENLLLALLKDDAVKASAAELYATGVVNKIITQIEAERKRRKPK